MTTAPSHPSARPTAQPSSFPSRVLTLLAVLATAMSALLLGPVAPAQAAARVQVESELGGATASITAPTTVTLSGSGFQSVQGGFGGLYVLFGWIASGDSWKPSTGGMTGTDYRYVPDSETKDNQGYQRFVTFPGSSTMGAANGGELHADGTWNTSMVIPGPVFDSVDRDGAVHRVDCREVRCGIITVGAHGVKNPPNETFTPIEFVGAATGTASRTADTSEAAPEVSGTGQSAAAPGATGTTDGTTTGAAAGPVSTGESSAAAGEGAGAAEGVDPAAEGSEVAVVGTGEPTIGLLSAKLDQGDVVSFTAQGFAPGEQIVATLDLGAGAAGPYQAGQYGDVAGTVPLPSDLRPGTHVLSLSGAGSTRVARVSFTVNEAEAAPIAGAIGETDLTWWTLAVLIGIALAAIVLLMLVVSALTALLRRRGIAKSTAKKAAALAAAEAAKTAPAADDTGRAPAQWVRRADAPAEDTAQVPVQDGPPEESGMHSRAPATVGMLLALGLATSTIVLGGAPVARADDGVDVTVQIPDTAEGAGAITGGALSWGLNEETGGGAYFGGCNFLIAGEAGDVGSSHVWSHEEGAEHYRAQAGNVSIVHPRSGAGDLTPTWDTKCLGADGSPVTTRPGSSTYNTAVYSGGAGEYDSAANTAKISWTGSTTIVYYGGMTYWTFSDPVLTVRADGSATLTATASGFGADMFDTSRWVKLAPQKITMATLRGVDVTASGIIATPGYEGVAIEVEAGGPSGAQNRSVTGWGSFPQDFIDFQTLTGQAAYWYTSGGLADLKKPASAMIVSWDAENPIDAELPTGSASGGDSSVGSVPVDGVGAVPVGDGAGAAVPNSGLVGSPGTANGSQPVGPGVAQPITPAGGGVVDPALLAGQGTEVTPASSHGLTVPQWLGGNLIPDAADAAFGTPARAATSFAITGALSLLLWQGLRRKWFALPFWPSK